jgi:hypothetical protein
MNAWLSGEKFLLSKNQYINQTFDYEISQYFMSSKTWERIRDRKICKIKIKFETTDNSYWISICFRLFSKQSEQFFSLFIPVFKSNAKITVKNLIKINFEK